MASQFSFKPQADQITREEHQCKHCGDWINNFGYMDDKHRTTNKVYCKYCDTAEKRRAVDEENKKIREQKI